VRPPGCRGLLSASALANAPWLDANAVTDHQLAGIVTLAVLVTLGGLSAAMLSSSRNASTLPRWGTTTVLVLALVGFGACLWTAYVGGRLRHSELRQARSSLNPRQLVSEGKAECGTTEVTHVDLKLEGKRALVTGSKSKYFTLSLDSLRAIGSWAADCAERALPVYETRAASDARPRAAIEGIREFVSGGKRASRLRVLAMEAHAAAREVADPAAAAAARAAGSAAASAYTHPLTDVHQTKHIVGPAAYAALALELEHAGDPGIGDEEVRWAIAHAPPQVGEVLLQISAREAGKSRLDTLLYELDAGIRARTLPQGP
jgi:hypothetical protein